MADVFIGKNAAHTEGRWVDYDDARLLVAEMPNERYNAKLAEVREAARNGSLKLIAEKETDSDKDFEIRLRAMSETVLIGWEGITSGGEPLEYSPDVALNVLTHNRNVLMLVMTSAQTEKEYRTTLADSLEKKPDA